MEHEAALKMKPKKTFKNGENPKFLKMHNKMKSVQPSNKTLNIELLFDFTCGSIKYNSLLVKILLRWST